MVVKPWGATTSARAHTLSGVTDAAGQMWCEVPGYGLVNWPVEQITEHARYFFGFHRPDQAIMRVRITWGFLPLVVWPSRHCKVCQTKWLCRTGTWAHDWLGSMEAARRNAVEAER